ncbi:organic hydroperoxide resistance protein [Pradoshia sp. D12]|jgi:osmotically inducible protein OsmC|uniref:organic hydroperoxide resistance protein n=1 Tax=Bacillaceae TaxID=186817 RepID=UPI00112B7B62|nr:MULTISPECIES: organic hydroperoxide resistance protein [Bacillaceae]QFK71149.1 organic hydroperoxide resistance protein [Pradoshia sp. D12]TPF72942.1 organic hydroperoxide resistance protein [Bacillus sp. D12]
MEPLYTATVTSTGGREGHVKSEDGIIDLDVRQPKALGGSGEQAANPELLFAAGYAACYDSALNLVLRKDRKKVDTTVTSNVTIGKDEEDGGFKLAVRLDVSIPGLDKEEVKKYADMAHQVCPYSKATRGNIEVTIITV